MAAFYCVVIISIFVARRGWAIFICETGFLHGEELRLYFDVWMDLWFGRCGQFKDIRILRRVDKASEAAATLMVCAGPDAMSFALPARTSAMRVRLTQNT